MTIEEAIEWLKPLTRKFRPRLNRGEREAVTLGIEALKHFKYHRDENIISFVKRLPGETED